MNKGNGDLSGKDVAELWKELNKNYNELVSRVSKSINKLDKIRQDYEDNSWISVLKKHFKLILTIIFALVILFYVFCLKNGFAIELGNFKFSTKPCVVKNSKLNS